MTHHSYNEFHLGDNLIHLHFLRKLALKYPDEFFVHAVQPCHLLQLGEAIEDVPNIRLDPLENKAAGSVNVWKNAGATVTGGQRSEGGGQNERYVPGFGSSIGSAITSPGFTWIGSIIWRAGWGWRTRSRNIKICGLIIRSCRQGVSALKGCWECTSASISSS